MTVGVAQGNDPSGIKERTAYVVMMGGNITNRKEQFDTANKVAASITSSVEAK